MSIILYILLAAIAIILLIQIIATSPLYCFMWEDIKDMYKEYKTKKQKGFDPYKNSFSSIASKPDSPWSILECFECGRWYKRMESDATMKQVFCSKECENKHSRRESGKQSTGSQ